MKIALDTAVQIHYTLKNDAGEVIDSSEGAEPLAYLHGHSNIIPGLERELDGKQAGERVNAVIEPADGYGEYDESLVRQIPRSEVQGAGEIEEGMQIHAQSDDGVHALTVIAVDDKNITLDGNHPLAGQTLHFDVEVVAVRDATEDELAHGHIHGPSDGESAHHHH